MPAGQLRHHHLAFRRRKATLGDSYLILALAVAKGQANFQGHALNQRNCALGITGSLIIAVGTTLPIVRSEAPGQSVPAAPTAVAPAPTGLEAAPTEQPAAKPRGFVLRFRTPKPGEFPRLGHRGP